MQNNPDTNNNPDLSPVVQRAMREDTEAADKLFMKILLVHWLAAATLMGYAHGLYLMGLVGGATICAIAFAGFKLLPGSAYSRMLVGISLMLFSALFIQQNLGRIEMHFHIFGALALLSRYKDIKPMLAAVVATATHHVVFNYCQEYNLSLFGQPLVIFDYGTGLDIVVIHALFVVFETSLLIYMNHQQTRQFKLGVLESSNIREVLDSMQHALQTGDVSLRVAQSNNYAGVVNSLFDWMNQNIAVTEAVNRASTPLMITDIDGTILQCNQATKDLILRTQDDYQAVGVELDANRLESTCVHPLIKAKNPIDFKALTTPQEQEFNVQNSIIRVILNPIINDSDELLGVVIEWQSLTERRQMEERVKAVVGAAARGDLEKRIEVTDEDGFISYIAEGMNHLLDIIDDIIFKASSVFASVARGDLSQTINSDYQGKFAELSRDVNQTIEKLTQTVQEIQKSARSVSDFSREISQGNHDLSKRTEIQATSLEETAASMEQMTSSVKSNASNASNASELAQNTRKQAEEGGQVVSNAVTAMSEIIESSQKMVNIISVIDEIAFQTNLLALNAAVEAARAGEQGRGFAVVASEVRTLAGRSAQAAREIKVLIEQSENKIGEGSRLVDISGETLKQIIQSVTQVSDIVTDIAQSSKEQTEGILQVNSAIDRMDEMTQQNSALAEQSAAASESMGTEAQALHKLVGFFSTEGDASTHPREENLKLVAAGGNR